VLGWRSGPSTILDTSTLAKKGRADKLPKGKPEPNDIPGISQLMKRNLKHLFIAALSGLLLAGCCTTLHTTEWEYKVIKAPSVVDPKVYEAQINDLSKSGWAFIEKDSDGLLFFKRGKK